MSGKDNWRAGQGRAEQSRRGQAKLHLLSPFLKVIGIECALSAILSVNQVNKIAMQYLENTLHKLKTIIGYFTVILFRKQKFPKNFQKN